MLWPVARLQLLAWTSPHRSHCPLTTPCCPSRTVVSVWGGSDPSWAGAGTGTPGPHQCGGHQSPGQAGQVCLGGLLDNAGSCCGVKSHQHDVKQM